MASGGGRSNGRFRARRYQPMSEINVTPFVDVMLVLLIVFMVTAPLLAVGVPVDLPQAPAEPLNDPEQPLIISVNAESKIFLNEEEIAETDLVPKLVTVSNNNRELRIYVRGDRVIQYGEVMRVMSLIAQAGFTKVALVAELPEPS